MQYRREIDGLRALAVIPVILFHAGIQTFSGGYVGVDIFFVISGFLITSIILAELEQEKFSLINFYDRRARRILPALFVMMTVTLLVGYFTLLPDEFKNLGQSVVATTLFSNNILLSFTSGYWDLNSEFKPLLHTWSLGVEEQYYFIFPLILLFMWKIPRAQVRITQLFILLFLSSLAFASWFVKVSPNLAFYTLPTRAWEILLGALTALYLNSKSEVSTNTKQANLFSLVGLLLISGSILLLDQSHPSPGFFMLLPTIGAVLIILYAREGTYAHKILGHKSLVFIGLISYSLYLWHQPIFSFIRAISTERPPTYIFTCSIFLVFFISYFSWKFIEKPFRNPKALSKRAVFGYALSASFALIGTGLFLNKDYGMPQRFFDSNTKITDIDKRIYNGNAFKFKADKFNSVNDKKILIIGNSFARDFINMTTENFNTNGVEIVYRDDFGGCILPYKNILMEDLFSSADAIVFSTDTFSNECVNSNISYAESFKKKLFYTGTKHFGYNLNWLIRLNPDNRKSQYNQIPQATLNVELDMEKSIPSQHFISLLSATTDNHKIPITDDQGRLLSPDRTHLTKFGAIYFGTKVLKKSEYANLFPNDQAPL